MEQYSRILQELKEKIRIARLRAAIAANAELISLYWQIGDTILQQQKNSGWGAKVIEQLAKDLRNEFSDMKGLSKRNLQYMRAFADAYPDFQFVQVPLAQITWYHHITLLDKVKDEKIRLIYIEATSEHGWSRDIMVHQIESYYHIRKGLTDHNFSGTLPPVQSDLVRQTFKDPYLFDFLTLGEKYQERDIETQLEQNISDFLLELGNGFAYVGRQVPIDVSGRDYFIDLLFYHLKLRCYVVIELKAVDFEPEFAGKLNFYLSAVDEQLKHPQDQPSIGLLICRSKDKTKVDYALRGLQTPIGISTYQLTDSLPTELKSSLPTIAEIESHLPPVKE